MSQSDSQCAIVPFPALHVVGYTRPVKMTLAVWLRLWISHKLGLSDKSRHRYNEVIEKHLIPEIGRHQLEKLRKSHIETYYRKALKSGRRDGTGGLATATVAYHAHVLSSALGSGYRDQGLICCQADGTPVMPDSLSHNFHRILEKAGIRRVRLHDLRHTQATTLLDQGADLKTIQARLGHRDARTTMNFYAHVTPGMQQAAADSLDRAFGEVEEVEEPESPE